VSIDAWASVRSERLGWVHDIETSSAEDWATPPLCAGWRVADVAGHLVFRAEGSQLTGTWYVWRDGRGVFVNRIVDWATGTGPLVGGPAPFPVEVARRCIRLSIWPREARKSWGP
jgi:hypothetical protein